MQAPSSSPPSSSRPGRGCARPANLWTGLCPAAALLASLSGCGSKPSTVTALTPPALAAAEAGAPAIACDPATHDVLLGWVAGDSTGWRLWFARSSDRGSTWTEPVAVSPPGEPLLAELDSPPRLVCDEEGYVAIAWSTSFAVPGRLGPASDVRFARSMDGGRSWSAPVTLNDDTTAGPGSHGFHDLAALPGGRLYAAWLDGRAGGDGMAADESEGHDAAVYLARSDDFGGHWGANSAQWSRACPCCRVSFVAELSGLTFAAFRKHYPGQVRDPVVGRPDGPPVRFHEELWKSVDCPFSGPALALSLDGSLRMAWFTGAAGRTGVWFRQALPATMDSTTSPLPVLMSKRLPTLHVGIGEAGMGGTLIAFDADSLGTRQLTLARIEPSGQRLVERFAVPASLGASHPTLATAETGHWAYVAWTSLAGERRALRLLRGDVGR